MGLLCMEAFQAVANHGREGMQRIGRSSQDKIVRAWGRVLVPSQVVHITVSLSFFFFNITKTTDKRKMLAFFIPEKVTV